MSDSPPVWRRSRPAFSSALMAKSAARVKLLMMSMSLLAVSTMTRTRRRTENRHWHARRAIHGQRISMKTWFRSAVPLMETSAGRKCPMSLLGY